MTDDHQTEHGPVARELTGTRLSDLAELAPALRSGALDLHDYLTLLESQFDWREDEVHAFVPERNRFGRLRHAATDLMARFPEPEGRPTLFGVPVGVKDIFHVQGMPTRAGSTLPPSVLHGEESEAVSALKEAGALVLGKTVTTEFAYFAPGPTRNPHRLDHTPGGSSSGSAAAVAAQLCPLALGTQTIGSVNRPAAFCGVVGFKPSYDRISRAGILPLSPSLDHVGFFVTSVAAAELAAAYLVGDWKPATKPSKPVFGIPRGGYLGHASAEGRAHFDSVAERLALTGHELKPVDLFDDFSEIVERHLQLMAAEAFAVHQERYQAYRDHYHAKTVALLEQGRAVEESKAEKARLGRASLRETLAAIMATQGVDLWLAPAAPGAAPKGLDSTGDPIMNLPWTHAGLPTLTLPAGKNEWGLPLGIQLVGSWYGDEELLCWAKGIEAILATGDA